MSDSNGRVLTDSAYKADAIGQLCELGEITWCGWRDSNSQNLRIRNPMQYPILLHPLGASDWTRTSRLLLRRKPLFQMSYTRLVEKWRIELQSGDSESPILSVELHLLGRDRGT